MRARAAEAKTEAGEAAIRAAEANGMWEFLGDVGRLELPGELDAALGGRRDGWDDWPRSVRRGTLEWVKTARTAPTRLKRIAAVVASLEDGLRPPPFRR